MKVADAVIQVLKREGLEFLSCFPANPLVDAAARNGVRPLICRQERVGVNIADGYSRVSGGRRTGVFAMQYGPGVENAFAGVAQAYSDSVPILLLPGGVPRPRQGVPPNFSAVRNYGAVTKWVEQVNLAERVPEMFRRAFTLLKAGRPGPVMLELPTDLLSEEAGEELVATYQPVRAVRAAADPREWTRRRGCWWRRGAPSSTRGRGYCTPGPRRSWCTWPRRSMPPW